MVSPYGRGKAKFWSSMKKGTSAIQRISNFDASKFKASEIRKHALKFDKELFKQKIQTYIEKKYREYINNIFSKRDAGCDNMASG